MSEASKTASIFSAASVVVSLVFVGYQVMQNTAMMRGGTMQAISDSYVEYVTAIGLDPNATDLLRRLHRGESTADFQPTENSQIIILFNGFVQILENSYLQNREGLVPDAVFESYGWGWGMIQTKRFQEYWENDIEWGVGADGRRSAGVVSPESAAFFESRVQIGPGDS